MTDAEQLAQMGFDPALIRAAMRATSNAGLQPAIDWMLANPNAAVEQVAATAGDGAAADPSSAPKDDGDDDDEASADQTANSLRCDDCGRLLRNADAAQLHAARTQHQNFSQSTATIAPLTEEQKAAKLAELQEKLAAKRREKEQAEAAEALQREKIRRHTGQDITAAKEKQAELEMKKALDAKRREKQEEQAARLKIRAQIEADKRARVEKAEREKLARTQQPQQQVSVSTSPSVPRVDAASYTEARIQIRLPGGPPLVQAFPADQTLRASVHRFLESKGFRTSTYSLSMAFPRKQFSAEDATKSLSELGLVPSASLVLATTGMST